MNQRGFDIAMFSPIPKKCLAFGRCKATGGRLMQELLRADEAERSGEVQRLLDSREEFTDSLRELCVLAAELCSVPIVMFNLLDFHSAWTVANFGFDDVRVDRCDSFCEHSMAVDGLLEISDTREDQRVSSNPFVIGQPHVRFYAGQPLFNRRGFRIGTLALYGFSPKKLTEQEKENLERFAKLATSLIEACGAVKSKLRSDAALEQERDFAHAVLDALTEGVVVCGEDGRLKTFNRAARAMHEHEVSAELSSSQWSTHYGLYTADGKQPLKPSELPLVRAFNGEHVHQFEMVLSNKLGKSRTLLGNAQPVFNKAGKKLGAVVTMHDVSDIKKKENLLKASNESLRASSGLAAIRSLEAGFRKT
ncbi:MAG: sensor histidine kinase [Proteobacteria bacterium]|nr:MAG: sensor histidine kinase [Pseudomonadota bacterium]